MPYIWNIYGLNKIIEWNAEVIESLEEELDCVIQHDFDSKELISDKFNVTYDDCDGNMYICLCFDLEQDNHRRESCDQFFKFLKNHTGVIIWPIKFDEIDMTGIIDCTIHEKEKWYDTKFEISTEPGKGIDKFVIELNASSCRSICNGSMENAYRDGILPYLYDKTGIKVEKLQINCIILTNLMTIYKDRIVTIQFKLSKGVLVSICNRKAI
ncbi:hypothetical protein KAFR_0D02720 [Kazachstania africana CBS 2517]|uniref:Uncharacterized protein n=1 Tax=Kazachstania africana (strain ATCC 22294 / BCRC 22015 / CBS 2517 / CECT 1963 / NBRC 1671 / NRRL Y-8276) TaxID=1071382 RepID=H2AU70_KAZAF|nr:hypothetical protein KAFR_0D02720 [Kazachstania africana CBS 2517]CCF57920.1 hypothetical protein KAFR_0D02720 [Kazachstania africana CBS 2517]